jgi:hypothetical protein
LVYGLLAIVLAGCVRTPDTLEVHRLPTGVVLDPVGSSIPLGSMPPAMTFSPDSTRVLVLLCGYREQSLQVVDVRSGRVTQTLTQPAAFPGLAFAPDGRTLYTSGGDRDVVYRYAWRDGAAALVDSLGLSRGAPGRHGTRYPSGLALSPHGLALSAAGDRLYVAEADHDAAAIFALGPVTADAPSAGAADTPLGRVVEAVSHSRFWEQTVVFVLEDDAQDGPDHVDSHRSPLLVISAWNRPGVVHRFANTTDVLATMGRILHFAPLSQFDHFGRPLGDIFAATPDPRPYVALRPGAPLDERSPADTTRASEMRQLDLRREDPANQELFNHVLWAMIKGPHRPYPEPRVGADRGAGVGRAVRSVEGPSGARREEHAGERECSVTTRRSRARPPVYGRVATARPAGPETPALARDRPSSARFSRSTFTRGSPRTPNWRGCVCAATRPCTAADVSPRAFATREIWSAAFAGLMSGSRPLPERVTASAGSGVPAASPFSCR